MFGEEEEDLVMLKLQVIRFKRSLRDHTRTQMAIFAVNGTLLLEERR